MYTIKIKHGFDLYHHALNGYYPSWDEVYQQYTAKAIDHHSTDTLLEEVACTPEVACSCAVRLKARPEHRRQSLRLLQLGVALKVSTALVVNYDYLLLYC